MPEEDFDPLADLSAEDMAYLERQRRAKARQEQAWANRPGADPDEAGRAVAAEAHRKATMEAAGLTPAEIAKRMQQAPPPTPAEVIATIPGAPPEIVAPAAPAVPATITIYRAEPVVSDVELPPKGEQFAPDWKTLKSLIVSHDGTWNVSQYELPIDVRVILGFFGKTGWAMVDEDLKELEKAKFGAIVKGGMVFRADPDDV